MLSINYHHLYYFWVTVKSGSITRARKTLLVSQPTLSVQLKQLEASFGKPLLFRSHRGVSLTSEGRVVFDHCERIFRQGEELAAVFLSGEVRQTPHIRLGVEDAIPLEVVLRVIDFFRKADKKTRVQIYGGTETDLKDMLRKHTVDLLISSLDPSPSLGKQFLSRLVARYPLVFAASPKLAKSVRRFPRDLWKIPLLLRRPDHPIRKQTDQILISCAKEPLIGSEIDNGDLLHRLALRGMGAAVLDSLTVAQDLRRGRLVRLNEKPLRIQAFIWFAAHRQSKTNKTVQDIRSRLFYDFAL